MFGEEGSISSWYPCTLVLLAVSTSSQGYFLGRVGCVLHTARKNQLEMQKEQPETEIPSAPWLGSVLLWEHLQFSKCLSLHVNSQGLSSIQV